MPKTKMNVKEELTLKIIEMMKQGGTDWTMPFRSLNGSPKNASTGKAYRGVNALWLGLLGQSTVAGYGHRS
jgi:antirestriction protein ArdC